MMQKLFTMHLTYKQQDCLLYYYKTTCSADVKVRRKLMDKFVDRIFILIGGLFIFLIAIWKKKHDFGRFFSIKTTKVFINSQSLYCIHCQYEEFERREGIMATTFLTFFRFSFLNESAVCFACKRCGFIHWFIKPQENLTYKDQA